MLVLPQELTHAQAAACARMLTQAVRAEPSGIVVADASDLRHFDSSALAVLLDCRRAAQGQGRGFSVHGLPARLRELAQLYGISELLGASA